MTEGDVACSLAPWGAEGALPAEAGPHESLAELRRRNDRRHDPLAFEHCDPWLVREPSPVGAERRLRDLDGLQERNLRCLEDASSRLRRAVASAGRGRGREQACSPRAAPPVSPARRAACGEGGSSGSASRPPSGGRAPVRPLRPGTAPSPRGAAAREDSEEDLRRDLENRLRANNWITETCPAAHGDDLARPWMMHHHAAVRQERLRAQVMRNLAQRGHCPFEEWLRRREQAGDGKDLGARTQMAALLAKLQSESHREVVQGLRSIYMHEAKEDPPSSGAGKEAEEVTKASRALRRATKTFKQDELEAAIRRATLWWRQRCDTSWKACGACRHRGRRSSTRGEEPMRGKKALEG